MNTNENTGLIAIHHLAMFHQVDPERWAWCARTKPWGLGKDEELRKVRNAMHLLVPVDAPITKDIQVVVKHGYGVAKHQHKEWTALLYVDLGSPSVPLVVEGKEIHPAPGDVVILPPFTDHAVQKSRSPTDRLSFAILVDQDWPESQAVAL